MEQVSIGDGWCVVGAAGATMPHDGEAVSVYGHRLSLAARVASLTTNANFHTGSVMIVSS